MSHLHEVQPTLPTISGAAVGLAGGGQRQAPAGGTGGVPVPFPSLPGPPAGLGFTTYCSRLWGAPFLPMIHRYPPLLPGPPEGSNSSKDRGKLLPFLFFFYDQAQSRRINPDNSMLKLLWDV